MGHDATRSIAGCNGGASLHSRVRNEAVMGEFADRNRMMIEEMSEVGASGAPKGYQPLRQGVPAPEGYRAVNSINIPKVLHAMGGCDGWRALTWEQRLDRAHYVLYRNSTSLNQNTEYQAASEFAHAIDAYCLGIGLRQQPSEEWIDTRVWAAIPVSPSPYSK